jgi:phosphoglycerate dehydrogenase-like enzyme
MSAPRLLVALKPSDEIERALTGTLPHIDWVYPAQLSPPSRAGVEAILLGSVERDLVGVSLRDLTRLSFVQRLYTGMDGVPFAQFPPGVRFAGNIGAYAPFVAEHAVALALAAARELPRSQAMVRDGELRPPPVQRLLWNRTALILGFGEIGQAIAARLAGFGTQLAGVNRLGTPVPGTVRMFAADHLREAVRDVDFVFDTRPLTRLTEGTIDRTVLESMRSTAVFVNVGRAGTVREEDLYRHLQSHPEFRAALDVWWHEDYVHGRLESRFPFAELPNFVGTPHSAGFGSGVERYVLDRAVANLKRFFDGEEPLHLMDPTEYARGPPER